MGRLLLRQVAITFLISLIILLSHTSIINNLQKEEKENYLINARNSMFECVDNSSTGDCDNDSITNSNEDLDGDGNWSNDDSDSDGIPNYFDEDDDDDGWPTWMECPLSPGQTHDDCPGFANVKDYLHENLYNCEQPFLQLSYAGNPLEFKLFIYVVNNNSLIELVHRIDDGGANSDRSPYDGRIHWINASTVVVNRSHHSWAPEDFLDEGSTNSTDGFIRMDFDNDGQMIAQSLNTLQSIDPLTRNKTQIGEFNQSTGGGGDLIVEDNGDIYLFSSAGAIYHVPNNSLNATIIGNISDIQGYDGRPLKGGLSLDNGSLMYNVGENIYLIEGDWRSGFNDSGFTTSGTQLSIQLLHSSSDITTGGDMANCRISEKDQDGDNIPDFYEDRVFLTNSSSYDTDLDGLSDGEEILSFETDPLLYDTDGDNCSDGDEINNFSTNPFIIDTNGDGVIDCLLPTTLNYQGFNFIFWDEVFPTLEPIISGPIPNLWNISPSPPSWLNFSEGIFSGTPGPQYFIESFNITCQGDGGEAQTSVTIDVKVPPPNIQYSNISFNYTMGDYIDIDVISSRGPVSNWSLIFENSSSAQIPQWLVFDEGNFSGHSEQSGIYNITIIAAGTLSSNGGIGGNYTESITIVVEDIPQNNSTGSEIITTDDDNNNDRVPEPKINLIIASILILIIMLIIILITYRLTRNRDEENLDDEKSDAGALLGIEP